MNTCDRWPDVRVAGLADSKHFPSVAAKWKLYNKAVLNKALTCEFHAPWRDRWIWMGTTSASNSLPSWFWLFVEPTFTWDCAVLLFCRSYVRFRVRTTWRTWPHDNKKTPRLYAKRWSHLQAGRVHLERRCSTRWPNRCSGCRCASPEASQVFLIMTNDSDLTLAEVCREKRRETSLIWLCLRLLDNLFVICNLLQIHQSCWGIVIQVA